MAVHQYIGARYVPLYYQNSLDPDSTEWEPNVVYEPLTVVTLPNNHSYISKKTVPDTIGSPALNQTYWLDTGSDNAYIHDLQDQVDQIKDMIAPTFDEITAYNAGDAVIYDGALYIFTVNHAAGAWDASEVTQIDILDYLDGKITIIQGDISALDTRIDGQDTKLVKIGAGDAVFIGDSYCTISTGYTKAIPEYLKDMMDFDHIYNFAIGGSGYVNGYGSNEDFQAQINSAISTLSADEKANVSYVFILGGQNDSSHPVASIVTAANLLFTTAIAGFPNAKIVVLPLWYNKAPTPANATRFQIMYYYAVQRGCLTDTKSWAYIINPTVVMMDSIHPDEDGIKFMASCIMNVVRGNDPVIRYTGGIGQTNNAIPITWASKKCTFDGQNVFINMLGSTTGAIAGNSVIAKIDPAFAPPIATWITCTSYNGVSYQLQISTGGSIYCDAGIPSGAAITIQGCYSLYGADMTFY